VIHFFQLFIKHSNFDTNESTVEIEDVDRCAQEDESEFLFQIFERWVITIWNIFRIIFFFNFRNYESCLSEYSEENLNKDYSLSTKSRSLYRRFIFDKLFRKNLFLLALARAFKWEFIAPFLLLLLQDCIIKPIQPVLIGLIIRYFYQLSSSSDQFDNSKISTSYCLLITVGLCVSSLLLIASHHPSLLLAMKLSMRVKIVWSSLIYNKVVVLFSFFQN